MPFSLDQTHDFSARIAARAARRPQGLFRFTAALLLALCLAESLVARTGSDLALSLLAAAACALWLTLLLVRGNAHPAEHIEIVDGEIVVARDGEAEKRLRVFGLGLETEDDADYGCLGLWLTLRDRRIEVAAALSPEERAEFVVALNAAVRAAGGAGWSERRARPTPVAEAEQAAGPA